MGVVDRVVLQELVVCFLKRASSNLRQDMCLEEPSRQLCLSDRQRILSHQLGNFIQLYNQVCGSAGRS